MGLLSGLFALMTALGMLWSLVLALGLGLVLAHVLGNSLGTRLRNSATRQTAVARQSSPTTVPPLSSLIAAGPTRLTRRAKLNRITLIMTVGGALVGAELGALGSTLIYPEAVAAAVLGVISAAVLGGFAGFLSSSFPIGSPPGPGRSPQRRRA